MIRVLIERRAKEGKYLLTPLRELRAEAMKQPGYISGETLVDVNNMQHISVISNWDNVKDWEDWHESKLRFELDQKVEQLLVEPAKITVFRYLSYQRNR